MQPLNFYIITDTHFGHEALHRCFGRPINYEYKILTSISSLVTPKDVLIHLGDVCWNSDAIWHLKMSIACKGKQWLVRGNHDKKSNAWYLSHGWDAVCNTMSLTMYGMNILFSHKPQEDIGYDINIHGHFHNSDPLVHEPELVLLKNDKQILVKIEHDYRPYNLKELCL